MVSLCLQQSDTSLAWPLTKIDGFLLGAGPRGGAGISKNLERRLAKMG